MVEARKKRLLVEGQDDKYAIPQLMERNGVVWGEAKAQWPVHIEACNGVDEILSQDFLSTRLKAPDYKIMGIIIDADDYSYRRWMSLRSVCNQFFPDLPEIIPLDGLIAHNTIDQKTLGVWIMPDNRSVGMIETFMKYLVPEQQEPLWLHAVQTTTEAVQKGAKYRLSHKEKACFYTWLAWQDEPGQSMGRALMQNILYAQSPYAGSFVNWFRTLFQV